MMHRLTPLSVLGTCVALKLENAQVKLPGVESANKKPIELTTLSISPRVFAVENFFR